MLIFTCQRTGREYGPEYVNILFDMVSRNLPEGLEGRFICVTDQPEEYDAPIERVSRLNTESFGTDDTVIPLSLNWIIIGPLDAIAKRGQLSLSDIHKFSVGDPFPTGHKIAYCAERKPHEIAKGWVPEVWKIGGGTVAEIIFDSTDRLDGILANIKAAHDRKANWLESAKPHEGIGVITAGGPSLARELASVKAMQSIGAQVFALSGAANFLISRGLKPDAHIILDSMPECLNFVSPEPMRRYYASQCCPEVLDAAGAELILWDSYMQGIEQIVPYSAGPFVGGGTTVGTRSICLLYALGFRQIHLFGLDSCYSGDVGHAYEQADYSKHMTVTCAGKKYKTSPQLVSQVEEFKQLVPQMLAKGVELYTYGDGLLQDVAAQMVAQKGEAA